MKKQRNVKQLGRNFEFLPRHQVVEQAADNEEEEQEVPEHPRNLVNNREHRKNSDGALLKLTISVANKVCFQ